MINKNINKYILSNFASVDSPHSVLTKLYKRVDGFNKTENGYNPKVSHLQNAINTSEWLNVISDSIEELIDGANSTPQLNANQNSHYSYPKTENPGYNNSHFVSLLSSIGWSYFGSIHPDRNKKNNYRELAFTIIPRESFTNKVNNSGFLVAVGVLSDDEQGYTGRYRNVDTISSAKEYIKSVMLNESMERYYKSLAIAQANVEINNIRKRDGRKKIDESTRRRIKETSERFAINEAKNMFSEENFNKAFFLLDESVDLTVAPDFIDKYLKPLINKHVDEARTHEEQIRAMREESSLGFNNSQDIDDLDKDVSQDNPDTTDSNIIDFSQESHDDEEIDDIDDDLDDDIDEHSKFEPTGNIASIIESSQEKEEKEEFIPGSELDNEEDYSELEIDIDSEEESTNPDEDVVDFNMNEDSDDIEEPVFVPGSEKDDDLEEIDFDEINAIDDEGDNGNPLDSDSNNQEDENGIDSETSISDLDNDIEDIEESDSDKIEEEIADSEKPVDSDNHNEVKSLNEILNSKIKKIIE